MDGGGCLLGSFYVCIAVSALAGPKSLTVTWEISLTATQYFHRGAKVICRSNGKVESHSRNMLVYYRYTYFMQMYVIINMQKCSLYVL